MCETSVLLRIQQEWAMHVNRRNIIKEIVQREASFSACKGANVHGDIKWCPMIE